MTREEAIECIKHELLINVNRKDLIGQAIGEALDMAIEALQAMDKVIEVEIHSGEYDIESGIVTYYNVPKAEPTHGRPIDADALKEYFFRPYSNEESYSNIDIAKIIDDAPTVQADRPHGVWEYTEATTDNDTYSEWVCSECGGSGYELMDFCPWCGADMRGEDE